MSADLGSALVPPAQLTLTPRHIRLALYCAAEELRARRDGGKASVLPWNAELIRALEHQLTVSDSRHGSEYGTPVSETWISAREAAEQLGLSKRQTQRLAADLDGRFIDGRWLFPLSAVTQYAEGRQRNDRAVA